jgi:hypothetical protein
MVIAVLPPLSDGKTQKLKNKYQINNKRNNVIMTGAHLSQLGFRFYISHRLLWLYQKHGLTTPRKREKFACKVKPETEKTHNHQSCTLPPADIFGFRHPTDSHIYVMQIKFILQQVAMCQFCSRTSRHLSILLRKSSFLDFIILRCVHT